MVSLIQQLKLLQGTCINYEETLVRVAELRAELREAGCVDIPPLKLIIGKLTNYMDIPSIKDNFPVFHQELQTAEIIVLKSW